MPSLLTLRRLAQQVIGGAGLLAAAIPAAAQSDSSCTKLVPMYNGRPQQAAEVLSGAPEPPPHRNYIVSFFVDSLGQIDSTSFALVNPAKRTVMGTDVLLSSEPDTTLRRKAWALVREMRFKPASHYGCRVGSWVSVPVLISRYP